MSGQRVRSPGYQKLRVRVIHIRDNRKGQPSRGAMVRPRFGETALLITRLVGTRIRTGASICLADDKKGYFLLTIPPILPLLIHHQLPWKWNDLRPLLWRFQTSCQSDSNDNDEMIVCSKFEPQHG
ncbi:hypothetical protein GWI33_015874 [Rhynchophorus ferrugineus]|uniref:Uncharacterized protein n=1 Tax=Rhynchophorus ferrugineus TaxID=354439 RepID=A0A834I2C4_RHYFE|nr:hypothetical protein GWI33_015874 [Rhynchophorus ferrugineus]